MLEDIYLYEVFNVAHFVTNTVFEQLCARSEVLQGSSQRLRCHHKLDRFLFRHGEMLTSNQTHQENLC